MKIFYNQIKDLVPGLKAGAKEIGEVLTFTGFMMDEFNEIIKDNKKDYLIGLEVRQNRADCLSVIGVAREVAGYYGLKVELPKISKIKEGENNLNIKVTADKEVKRVLAFQVDNIKNSKSPDWLKEYLELYGMNSIDLLVDLSNYIMILTGYPSHLIDIKKVEGGISWSMNDEFKKITTLDGTELGLNKDEVIIRDEKKIIALAGIVGGREAEIDMKTTSLIVEVAVYNRSIIRKNARSLHLATEASNRLDKDLDPNGADYAINLLVSMILEHAGGEVVSSGFNYYPNKFNTREVELDLNMPSIFSGVDISKDFSIKTLKNLNFEIKEKGKGKIVAKAPTYRMDILQPEDLVEEIIRMYRYDRIPFNEIPALKITKNITPLNIPLTEKIRDILISNGFDEILSWPLTKIKDNEKVNYLDWGKVSTINSVNEFYPDLRQSIASGLLNQLAEFGKNNVDLVNIFEIGKVFGKKGEKYFEHESLGVLSFYKKKNISVFKEKIENLLRLIGLINIKYVESKKVPEISNPGTCFDIYVSGKFVGILYKLKPQEVGGNVYFSELNIEKITELVIKTKNNPTVEITKKLLILDANIELNIKENIYEYLEETRKKIKPKNIWSISIEDAFPSGGNVKYTVRITYKELSDQQAKDIHLKAFNLSHL
jgi:phenylalanyl-tRNA synthetase beta chain